MRHHNNIARYAAFALGIGTLACGGENDAANAQLTVFLESDEAIVEGISPGKDSENMRDGWTLNFGKYIVTVGDIDIHLATDASVQEEAAEVFAVDLTQVPQSGLPLWKLKGLDKGRWEFNYTTPKANDDSTRHESVARKDYDEMVDNSWTYLIEGVLTKEDGESCPPAALAAPQNKQSNGNTSGGNDCYDTTSIQFIFGSPAETSYGPCEIDGVPGLSVPANGSQTVAATIHGDHLFFNGFPEGSEGGIMRLAQWLADCDLDLDGTVTQTELESIAPSQLPEIDDRYQLGGSPITPLENMYEYLTSQLKTQGHFQGEGECPLDGVAHEH